MRENTAQKQCFFDYINTSFRCNYLVTLKTYTILINNKGRDCTVKWELDCIPILLTGGTVVIAEQFDHKGE